MSDQESFRSPWLTAKIATRGELCSAETFSRQRSDSRSKSLAARPIAPLENLAQLERLYLSNTQIEDLAPLAHLKELRELGIAGTRVRDLTPLWGLSGLSKLDMKATDVSKEQYEALRKALPSCVITHDFGP